MDDPIFDPWCLDDETVSQPPPASPSTPSRWRSASKGSPVPAQRPIPRPLDPPAADPLAVDPPALDPPALDPPADDAAEARPRLNDLAELIADIESGSSSASGPERTTRRPQNPPSMLRDVLKSRIDALALRLTTARHRTTVDDRLEQDPPALRFRIEPWAGPFDGAEDRRAAVLECVLEGGAEGTLTVRIWLDPLSTEPTEQRSLDVARLTETWMDRLLLDFVEQALGGR